MVICDVKPNIKKFFHAVEYGYDYWFETPYTNKEGDRFLIVTVENPDFKQDDGSDPYIALEIKI